MISALISKITKSFLGFVLSWGGQILLDLILKIIEKYKRKKEQDEAKEKLDQVTNDPNSKPDDRAKAYEDYINS